MDTRLDERAVGYVSHSDREYWDIAVKADTGMPIRLTKSGNHTGRMCWCE